jgi:hypothetical protein
MSALMMTKGGACLSPPFTRPSDAQTIPSRSLTKLVGALIVATALVAPDCCLIQSHDHGLNLDGLGSICFARVVWR